MGGPNSGRKPGSGGRKPGAKGLVTDKVKGDLLAVYEKLGGQRWLLAYAVAHEDEFCRHLMRLVPPAPPEAPEPAPIDTSPASMREVAVRIAFVLASADVAMARPLDVPMVELAPAPEPAFHYQPEEPQDPPLPPLDEAPVDDPPVPMPRRRERVEETHTQTIETYRGGSTEQGSHPGRPDVIDQRRKVHEDYVNRLAARHRRDLL